MKSRRSEKNRKIPRIHGRTRTKKSRRRAPRLERSVRGHASEPGDGEEPFRAYVEQAYDLIFALDISGKLVFANPATCEVTGYTAEELHGRNPLDFVVPEYRDGIAKAVDKISRGERIGRVEAEILSKDGRRIRLEVRGRPLNQTGSRARSFYIARDVTGRKQMEDAMRVSEVRYRAVIEDQTELICRYLPDGKLTFVNEAYCRYFSKKREELIGHRFMPVPSEDRGMVEKRVASITPENPTVTYDQHVVLPTGEIRWQQWSDRGLFDEQARLVEVQAVGRDITERKRLELELQKSRQFLESIIENANVWLDVLDEKANVVLWNKAAEVISGYSREEVVGHGKIWEWLYPDEQYRRYLTALVAEVIQRGRVEEDFETTIRRKDGQIRIISWNERNLLDEQGKVIGSIAIGRDTTEHKRMEEELKRYSTKLEEMVVERTGKLAESEKRFRELADLLPQIVFETDEKGNLTFGNRAGFALTGHSQEDLDRGLNALELFVPEDRSRARDRISRVLSGESSAGTEYMVLRRDGSTFPVIIHTSAILSGGRAVGLRGIAIDITERKRAEEELRAAKERLDYVVASNPAVIFTGKPHSDFKDFDITYMSPNVASMLGYEPREFIDDPKFWDRHVHPEDGPRALAEIPRLFRDGHLSSDQRFMHKDGRYVWIHAEATVMRDKTGNPLEVIGYWTDVTEQKRMEEAILKSERLAAVGELATMVAHDLRNPLTGISGAAYHLKKKLGPSADQKSREMFDLIDKDVEYANKILGDLLEYSGEVRLEVSETNPGSIIAQALAKVEIPGNVRIHDLAKDSPHFVADTEKMTRVFVNLIKNAVEAMPQGGELAIRSEESDGNLRLEFSDTGTGITEDAMGRIWTPFYTTKAKGMGLGLSISKRITEAHKGHISLESTVGKGTTITVSIPLGTRSGR